MDKTKLINTKEFMKEVATNALYAEFKTNLVLFAITGAVCLGINAYHIAKGDTSVSEAVEG